MPKPRLIALAALAVPGIVSAQGLPIPFLPHVYVGVEGGQGTRGTGDYRTGARLGSKEKSADYGAFAGVELPTLPFGYVAVEGNIGKSDSRTRGVAGTGANAVTTEGKADWNWSATARLGINAIPGLAAYGLAGYGAEKVAITRFSPVALVAPGADRRTLDGLVYGLGARYTFGTHLGARLEYRKRMTDGNYDPKQLMAGLYFRL
jgi:hypothetical protein